MPRRVTIDGISVVPAEALDHMVFCMSMAARLFEAIGEDADTRKDFHRYLKRTVGDEHVVKASLAFYDSLHEAYEAMKKDD